MESYLLRFQKMVEELREHPKVQVTHFHTFPPASDQEIEKVEQALGYSLHSSIREFYQQTNGLQLLWIYTLNEQFDSEVHFERKQPLDFYRQYHDYYPEDGAVMIQPIHSAFLHDWKEQVYFDFMTHEEEEEFLDKKYGSLDFHQKLKPFDAFNKYYDMAFFLDGSSNPPVILGDDHQACYTDSKVTDFSSYLEFILANKGAVSRRKNFYHQFSGHRSPVLKTPTSFFTKDHILDLDIFLLKDIFPLSDQNGNSTAALKTQQMQSIAQSSKPITRPQFDAMMKNHHLFLASGGAGGRWQTVHVSGLVIGIYTGTKNQEGEQANFERKHIPPRLDFIETDLPFSNFCSSYAKRVDFSEADLSHSLFTDAMLDETIFAETQLKGVDFSRASLKNANFMNANLQNTDFENCNLEGADFTGANLEGSRFPGANLKGVKR